MTRIHILCAPRRQDRIRRRLEPLGDTVVHWHRSAFGFEGMQFERGDRLLVSREYLLDAGEFAPIWRSQVRYPHLVVELVE